MADHALAVIEEARRRAELLDAWAHPGRAAPLVLPESLPVPVPPWPAEHEVRT